MAPSTKPATNPTPRRKSTKSSLVVTLKLSPKALGAFAPSPTSVKEESPSKDSTAPAVSQPVAASSNGDNPSESNSNTPIPAGTPGSTLMPPPTEGVKKKGAKRGAAALDPNAPPKVRGKPGPKKKARLEDGSIDHSATVPRSANATKLGPKANQGAINAGLRALDRSGKPCRKWQKGSFKMKSFTGVVWELPRWKAPPKIVAEKKPDEQSASASGESSKENKGNSQLNSIKSEKSNSGPDVEMGNTPSQDASSPAPSVPAAEAVSTPVATPAAEATPVITATA